MILQIKSCADTTYPALSFFLGNRTGIRQHTNFFDRVVTETNDVDFHIRLQMRSTYIAVKCNTSFYFFILVDQTGVCDILMPINNDIWMSISPNKRAELRIKKYERVRKAPERV